MRVMHIISGLTNGGAEAILYRLVTHPGDDEHCVVSMMDEGHYGPRLREAGVEVIELGMPPGKLTGGGLRRLHRLLRERRPDAVQTWMYHADLVGGSLARLAGRRRVVWGIHHTTLDPAMTSRTIRTLARLCAAASWIVPARVISCSEEGVDVHARLGYRRSRLVTVHNGYDVEEFSPSASARARTRAALGVDDDTTLLGMVGRWHEQKDHENLVRALAALREREPRGWRCVMVGPRVDESNETLRESRARHGLDDVLALSGPTDDVPGMMNALDLHVLPSAFGEAFPNVVAEAMACGTPCVVTDVGDARMMVGECGWSVPPRDPRALSTALADALSARRSDPAAWLERERDCVRRVREHFSLVRMAGAYREIWRASDAIRRNSQT